MNNYNELNINQESKAELIIKYIDGNYTSAERHIVEALLANDDFSKSFFDCMTDIETDMRTLSNTSLSQTATANITNNVLSKYTLKQNSATKFKSYDWHVVTVSFLILSSIGVYSIKNNKLSLFTSIYADWGNYIGTFYMVGMTALLLLVFDMALKGKSNRNHRYKHT